MEFPSIMKGKPTSQMLVQRKNLGKNDPDIQTGEDILSTGIPSKTT